MGSFLSGNWGGSGIRKITVEESVVLAVKDIWKQRRDPTRGFLKIRAPGGIWTAGYDLDWHGFEPTVTLNYRLRGHDRFTLSIRMESRIYRVGGERWFFNCPIPMPDGTCSRRATKLYLPPGARRFGCRACHDLAYRSSQEWSGNGRCFARIGLDRASGKELLARWERERQWQIRRASDARGGESSTKLDEASEAAKRAGSYRH
jgi:hypothetical protein